MCMYVEAGSCYATLIDLEIAIYTGWSQTRYLAQVGLELLAILQSQLPDAAITGMCHQVGLWMWFGNDISSNRLEVASCPATEVACSALRIYLCVCASGLRASLANSSICVLCVLWEGWKCQGVNALPKVLGSGCWKLVGIRYCRVLFPMRETKLFFSQHAWSLHMGLLMHMLGCPSLIVISSFQLPHRCFR